MSRSGGLKAHQNGAAFEELIERACSNYLRAGRAYIEKTGDCIENAASQW